MVKLKSKHWWEITEAFIERRRAGDKPVGTPDHVVTAMLEDLRALEAECERLRAMLPSAEVRAGLRDCVAFRLEYVRLMSYDEEAQVSVVWQWLQSLESEAADDR